MKSTLTALLAVALCASAFAGRLIDSANVFGPKGYEVNSALAQKPVVIETLVTTPTGGIKAYADAHAVAENGTGFYVVITSQPREWRVSMNPVGLASSEGVRLAGEAMTAQFRKGHFSDGAIDLSRRLVSLTGPHPEKANEESFFDSDFWFWFFVVLAIIAIVVFLCWLCSLSGGGGGGSSSSSFIYFGGSSGGYDSGSSTSSSDSGSSSSDSSGGGGSW